MDKAWLLPWEQNAQYNVWGGQPYKPFFDDTHIRAVTKIGVYEVSPSMERNPNWTFSYGHHGTWICCQGCSRTIDEAKIKAEAHYLERIAEFAVVLESGQVAVSRKTADDCLFLLQGMDRLLGAETESGKHNQALVAELTNALKEKTK